MNSDLRVAARLEMVREGFEPREEPRQVEVAAQQRRVDVINVHDVDEDNVQDVEQVESAPLLRVEAEAREPSPDLGPVLAHRARDGVDVSVVLLEQRREPLAEGRVLGRE